RRQTTAVATSDTTPTPSHACDEVAWTCISAMQATPVAAIPTPNPAKRVALKSGRRAGDTRSSAQPEASGNTQPVASPAMNRSTTHAGTRLREPHRQRRERDREQPPAQRRRQTHTHHGRRDGADERSEVIRGREPGPVGD